MGSLADLRAWRTHWLYFALISFVVTATLTTGFLALFAFRLNSQDRLIQSHEHAMEAGPVAANDPSSIEAIQSDAADFRWTVVAYACGAVAFAYLTNVLIVRRSWRRDERHGQVLRESEERYRDLFENSTDLIQSVGADGRFQYVNRAWSRALGYSPAEATRMDMLAIIHPDSRQHCAQTFGRGLAGDETGRVEAVFVDRQGNAIAVEGSISSHVVDGKPIATRGIFRDISARKETEERLKSSLREKEVLLKEMHHRVKNNLQLISSLQSLQMEDSDHPELNDAMLGGQVRIRSIALIHEELYSSGDLARIDFGRYLGALAAYLFRSHQPATAARGIEVGCDAVDLGVDVAIPCGLLVSELVSNSLKHAYVDGDGGQVRVALRAIGDGSFQLTVADDGVGLPPGMEFPHGGSLGWRMVDTLVDELEGRVELDREGGTAFIVGFTEPQRSNESPDGNDSFGDEGRATNLAGALPFARRASEDVRSSRSD